MKSKLFPLMLFCLLMATSSIQSQSNNIYKNQKTVTYNTNVNSPLTNIELAKITEVYGENTSNYVLNNFQKLKRIKNILRNRVEVLNLTNPSDQKTCPNLSEVALMDYYVDTLERDMNFNPQTFNPLKYLFNFSSNGTSIYRVDNTNYFIYIKSQYNN